mmetsp:Transcript_11284/g.27598  ORF Transcript_11284/g.27598 Transcript_11284/m.27598 type:complete len:328 (-) Transcript_11284:1782-2765(-)
MEAAGGGAAPQRAQIPARPKILPGANARSGVYAGQFRLGLDVPGADQHLRGLRGRDAPRKTGRRERPQSGLGRRRPLSRFVDWWARQPAGFRQLPGPVLGPWDGGPKNLLRPRSLFRVLRPRFHLRALLRGQDHERCASLLSRPRAGHERGERGAALGHFRPGAVVRNAVPFVRQRHRPGRRRERRRLHRAAGREGRGGGEGVCLRTVPGPVPDAHGQRRAERTAKCVYVSARAGGTTTTRRYYSKNIIIKATTAGAAAPTGPGEAVGAERHAGRRTVRGGRGQGAARGVRTPKRARGRADARRGRRGLPGQGFDPSSLEREEGCFR